MKLSTLFFLSLIGALFFASLNPVRASFIRGDDDVDSTSEEEEEEEATFEYTFEMKPHQVMVEIEKEGPDFEHSLEFKINNQKGLYVKMEIENESGELETETETKLRMREIIIFQRASVDETYTHGTSVVDATYDLTSKAFTDFSQTAVSSTVTSFSTGTTDDKFKAVFYVTNVDTKEGENYFTPTSVKFDLIFNFNITANQGIAMLCKMDTDVEVENEASQEATAGKAVLPEGQIGGGVGFFSFATKAKAEGAASSELAVVVSNTVKDTDKDEDDEKREYSNTQKFYATFKTTNGKFTWDPKLGTSSKSLPNSPAAAVIAGFTMFLIAFLF